MKKSLLIKTILFSVVMLFTGCGGNTSQPLILEEKGKQEITIALDYTTSMLYGDVITTFNEQSENYYVTILTQKDDFNTFREKIMKEIEFGKGPDIMTLDFLNVNDYIKKGYLQTWDGVFTDNEIEELFFPGVIDYGKYDEKLYGFPYKWMVHVLITSKENCNGLESWNINEMQECVKKSNVQCIAVNMNGVDFINYSVLCDKTNKNFIDWENQTCNFKKEEFYDLLKFAKQYESKEYSYSFFNDENGVKNGEEFAWYTSFSFCNMNYYEAIFGKDVVYIGYPMNKGNGIYAYTSNLFFNSNCQKEEGVKEFMRYLLSKDVQDCLVNEQVKRNAGGSYSIRKDTMDYHIELEKKSRQNSAAFELFGELHANPGMSDEQEIQARKLINNITFYSHEMNELYISTIGALYEYFYGEQSEAETAELLQEAIEMYFKE